jgi:dihydropteroate synthase
MTGQRPSPDGLCESGSDSANRIHKVGDAPAGDGIHAAPESTAPFEVMGIVNITPDSFSDGGRYLDTRSALAHGLELAREGAAILDLGGESTRPGADPVPADEECRRVIPVIEGLVTAGVEARISVDTSKARVAERALAAGATIVNDVTALRAAPQIAELVAQAGAQLCLMHMVGTPRTMQQDPYYEDVVAEVKRFLEERMAFATSHGVAEERIILDPGIGFGKTVAHNLELIRRLPELLTLGRPLLIGTSRKSFLGHLTGREVDDRLPGTIATNVLAYERGATIFRVHDVAPLLDALTVAAATITA